MKTTLPLFAVGLAAVGMLSQKAQADTVSLDAVSSGKVWQSGAVGGTPGIITAAPSYRSWLGFDLSSIDGDILGASLEVWSDSRNASGQTINLWDFSPSNVGVSSPGTFADLGTGTSYGSGTHTAGIVNYYILNNAALASLNATEGAWAVGLQNTSGAYAHGYTWGIASGDHLKLTLTLADDVQGQVVRVTPVPDGGSAVSLMGLGLLGLLGLKRASIKRA